MKCKILRNKLNILATILFLGILSCCFAQNNDKKEPLTVDLLMNIVQENFEVEEIKLLKDTILIYSSNEMLFYPFGEYRNFKTFQEQYLEKQVKDLKIERIQNKVITIQSKNSFLKFVEIKTVRKGSQGLEIVFANIYDTDFVFVNEIKIGMNKKDLLLNFFSIIPEELEKIPIVEIATALQGIWYYFTFSEDNTIKNIIIKTDYKL